MTDEPAPPWSSADDDDAFVRAPRRWRLGVGAALALVILVLAATVGVGVVRSAVAGEDEMFTPGGDAGAGGVQLSDGAGGTRPAQGGAGQAEAVYVHVTGEVRSSGIYVLAADARVADAIAAAGGFSSDAAEDGINLARPVKDGEQIIVPTLADMESGAGAGAGPGAGAAGLVGGAGDSGGLIDINTATAAQLEELPRIGPSLAARIVQWREQNGDFTSVDELLLVSGIGEKLLDGLRDLVTV